MDAKRKTKLPVLLLLLFSMLLIIACSCGKSRSSGSSNDYSSSGSSGGGGFFGNEQIPLNYSFAMMSDLNLFFLGTFTDNVDGLTLTLYDPGSGSLLTVYDDAYISANTFISLGIAQGWTWLPEQEITISADGYETIEITLPESGNEWDTFVNQAYANANSSGSSSSSNDGPSLNEQQVYEHNCQKAREEYDSCMEMYNNTDDPVYQNMWLGICQGWEEQINNYCY